MGIKSLFGFGQARDKPVRNYSNGEYSFNFGRSTSGKSVNEMTAMQTTAVYAFTPYLVRVSIDDLNIRKGPGTDYDKTGKHTGKGAFTIVEEAEGKGASLWGLLKYYQKNCDGWISLDYAERV